MWELMIPIIPAVPSRESTWAMQLAFPWCVKRSARRPRWNRGAFELAAQDRERATEPQGGAHLELHNVHTNLLNVRSRAMARPDFLPR